MDKKLVVLAAFACDPNIPSEPSIGWEYLKTWISLAMSRDEVELIAFMNKRSKVATEARLLEDGVDISDCVRIIGTPLPKLLKFLENPYLTRIEYLVWCVLVERNLRLMPLQPNILLARHVTFASELLPTPISALRDRVFKVWGPVGSSGMANVFRIPPRHRQWRSHFIFQKLRDLVSRIQSRRIGARVDLVLATSRSLAADLQAAGIRAVAFPNTRLDAKSIDFIDRGSVRKSKPVERANKKSLQLICVGNLVYLKRFELAIAALTDPQLHEAELRIIGKPAPGKENYLRRIADELSVGDRVTFDGQLPREDVLSSMMNADVLIHPSTREGGSGVVGEATAVGLPVVCFQGTGAAVVLDYSGGHGVQVDATYTSSVQKLADAVIEASHMPHVPATIWREDRYLGEETRLLEEALARSEAAT